MVDEGMPGAGRGPHRRCRVITEHRISYPDPLAVVGSEEVTTGERDTRWPYIWCINKEGKGGWVPLSYVRIEGEGRGRVLQDFDTAFIDAPFAA